MKINFQFLAKPTSAIEGAHEEYMLKFKNLEMFRQIACATLDSPGTLCYFHLLFILSRTWYSQFYNDNDDHTFILAIVMCVVLFLRIVILHFPNH